MPTGRPRTAIPEKDELIELGKDLVNWASEQTEELRCQYAQWYCVKHGFIKKQWEHMREKPEFQCYYEQARQLIGLRYVDGSVNQSIAHRFLRVYVPEVKEQEDEDLKNKLKEEAKAKKEVDQNNTQELKQCFVAVMDQLKINQDGHALKIEESNNSNEAKS